MTWTFGRAADGLSSLEVMIRINDRLSIPPEEIVVETSTSGGPGGQHVNRVRTRVTLSFDVDASPALDDEQRERIRERLASRLTRSGVLQVRSERHRSQRMNREDAIEKFAALLAEALTPPVMRRRTRIPSTAKARRLEEKRRRSDVKQGRRKPGDDG